MLESADERALNFLRSQWEIQKPALSFPPGDASAIVQVMTSGKWRRSALDSHSRTDTQRKVEDALQEGGPIEFAVPFGGYKSHLATSYPHLNWAEVFVVNFLRRFAVAVANISHRKIVVSFSYCGDVMDIVNNMPLNDQELYLAELRNILSIFSDERIELRLFDIGSLFASPLELRETLKSAAAEISNEWASLSGEVREKRIQSASRNLQIVGLEDLSRLSSELLDQHILRAAIMCEALDSLPERRRFNKFSSRIQLVHVRGPVPAIHIASCDTSANHFGVGTGVVEVRSDRCLQRIMTTSQIADSRLRVLPAGLVSKGFAGLQQAFVLES